MLSLTTILGALWDTLLKPPAKCDLQVWKVFLSSRQMLDQDLPKAGFEDGAWGIRTPACKEDSDPREEERRVRKWVEKRKVKNKMDSADKGSLYAEIKKATLEVAEQEKFFINQSFNRKLVGRPVTLLIAYYCVCLCISVHSIVYHCVPLCIIVYQFCLY